VDGTVIRLESAVTGALNWHGQHDIEVVVDGWREAVGRRG